MQNKGSDDFMKAILIVLIYKIIFSVDVCVNVVNAKIFTLSVTTKQAYYCNMENTLSLLQYLYKLQQLVCDWSEGRYFKNSPCL